VFKADLPATDIAALEEELAYLYEAFSAIPDGFDHEHPDDPASYAEAMASPYAVQWTAALKEEFESLKDLGVYKLVPAHRFLPDGNL
jgi:hypothetical protein